MGFSELPGFCKSMFSFKFGKFSLMDYSNMSSPVLLSPSGPPKIHMSDCVMCSLEPAVLFIFLNLLSVLQMR